jgi:hypothetical protein
LSTEAGPAEFGLRFCEVVNAANNGCAAAPGAAAHPDPPERAMGRRWLAVAATALVTAYVALVVVPAAETGVG